MKVRDEGKRHRGPLSDRQWNQIERISGLPPQARQDIEYGIRSYLGFQELRAAPPAESREKLRRLSDQAKKLLRGLEDALADDDLYLYLAPVGSNEWHPQNVEQRRRHLAKHGPTKKARADLRKIIDWLDQSRRRPSRGNPGPSAEDAQNVYLLVDSVDDALRHHTGKRLTRSEHHRRMMQELFAIVDREVGRGTIDTAMKKVIANDKYKSRRSGPLLPGSRARFEDLRSRS